MNAPYIGPKGEAKLFPDAQMKARTILAMMQRGMRYEEAYAALMAQQPHNPGVPTVSRAGTTKEAKIAADVLAHIQANPGMTRVGLSDALGVTVFQFDSALTRLRTAGLCHCIKKRGHPTTYHAGAAGEIPGVAA